MLTITDAARTFISAIPSYTRAPDTAGLRIAVHGTDRPGLSVGAVDRPQFGDTLVEEDGARVYLGPVAGKRLSSHVLDLRVDDEGRHEFVTRPAKA